MYIQRYIYQIICDANMDQYNEFIQMVKSELKENIHIIMNCMNSKNIILIRLYIHKLINIISYLDNNKELFYICKLILAIPKTEFNFEKYENYLKMILDYNFDYLFH